MKPIHCAVFYGGPHERELISFDAAHLPGVGDLLDINGKVYRVAVRYWSGFDSDDVIVGLYVVEGP